MVAQEVEDAWETRPFLLLHPDTPALVGGSWDPQWQTCVRCLWNSESGAGGPGQGSGGG